MGRCLLSHNHTIAVSVSSRWSAALQCFVCLVMVARTASFVIYSLYEMPSTLLRQLISTALIFLCSSAVSVHVSYAYKTIDRINACSSFSLDDKTFIFVPPHGFQCCCCLCCSCLDFSL